MLPSVPCGGHQPCPMAMRMVAQRHWHRVVAPDPKASRHQRERELLLWGGWGEGGGSETNLSEEEGSPSLVLAAGLVEGPQLIFGREPQVTAALRPGLSPAPSGWGEAKALVRTAQSGTSSHSGQGWGSLQATTNVWLKTLS